jgi:adenosylmethionine-8-amino-7-oxononanoate aminotransferase
MEQDREKMLDLTREQIEKVQQKNAITRAVGVYERVEVDTLVIELIAGDTLVLTPPLIISEDQIGEIMDKLGKVIRAVA